MLSAFKNFLITFGISVVVFGLIAYFTVSYAVGAMTSTPGEAAQPDDPEDTDISFETTAPPDDGNKLPETKGRSFNVLLIGTDLQENRFDDYDPDLWLWELEKYEMPEISDETLRKQSGLFRYRTAEADSMVVMRVDKEKREFTFTYIPGNMIVLAEGGEVEIGSLYSTKGVDILRQKAEAVTGLRIDYHVCVSVEELEEVINEIGTVEFDVPCKMEYEDEFQDLVIDLPKGKTRLAGSGASQLLRFNGYTGGSENRGTTTVKYVMALMARAASASNRTSVAQLYEKLYDLVDTNITVDFLLENADLIFSYSDYNCYELTYPGKYTTDGDGNQIFEPEIKNAINMFYNYRLPYDIKQ
ncbi:MAG: LCP family protein [Clostridia bacterium]|nr:LCP family protein [Clostridia bacterium]